MLFSEIMGLVVFLTLPASAHALTIPIPATTTIHVEDPELCRTYPVMTKELAVKKTSGRPLTYDAYAGRQYIIEATLSADCYYTTAKDGNYPFLTIIEVRDSDGITQHLALHQGTIEPWTGKSIGFSWIPDKPGEYEIRSFSMPDLNGRIVLAKIVTTTVKVIEG